MGSRLGRRVVHFANLPIKLLMPSDTSPAALASIREVALKTVPSASKVEIRRVLESLYGFDVAEVRTLNMEGKKRKRGGILLAKPDYKKAYVTLRTPLSLSPDLFPIRAVEEERVRTKQQAQRQTVVVGDDGDGKGRHWLDDKGGGGGNRAKQFHGRRAPGEKKERKPAGRGGGRGKVGLAVATEEGSRFPWSSMRSWRK
uniref:Large ribosomal subunit protein uL23m n=1 Tax=Anthurium amnicola TaxID=1678845 RepID=A0A1D1Z0M0_9ARAE